MKATKDSWVKGNGCKPLNGSDFQMMIFIVALFDCLPGSTFGTAGLGSICSLKKNSWQWKGQITPMEPSCGNKHFALDTK